MSFKRSDVACILPLPGMQKVQGSIPGWAKFYSWNFILIIVLTITVLHLWKHNLLIRLMFEINLLITTMFQ